MFTREMIPVLHGSLKQLSTHLGLDLVSILLGELLLPGGWDEDVAVGLQDAALVRLGLGEAHDSAVLL